MEGYIVTVNIDNELPSSISERLLQPESLSKSTYTKTEAKHSSTFICSKNNLLHKNVWYYSHRRCLPAASTLYVTVEESNTTEHTILNSMSNNLTTTSSVTGIKDNNIEHKQLISWHLFVFIDNEHVHLLLQPHPASEMTTWKSYKHNSNQHNNKEEYLQSNQEQSLEEEEEWEEEEIVEKYNYNKCILHEYLTSVLRATLQEIESNASNTDNNNSMKKYQLHQNLKKELETSNSHVDCCKVHVICVSGLRRHIDSETNSSSSSSNVYHNSINKKRTCTISSNVNSLSSKPHFRSSRAKKELALLYTEAIAWSTFQRVSLGMCTYVDSPCDAVAQVISTIYHLAKELSTLHLSTISALKNKINTNVIVHDRNSNNNNNNNNYSNNNNINVSSNSNEEEELLQLQVYTQAMKHVRPECSRKCEPTDFHHLYKNMLMEINTFASRKVMATMAAFPTMYALLSHINSSMNYNNKKILVLPSSSEELLLHKSYINVSVDDKHKKNSNENAQYQVSGVYNINYGEQRGYNVINDDIVQAISCNYIDEVYDE